MDSSTSNETYNASPNQMTPNPMRLGSLGAFAPPDEIIFLIFLLSLGSLACGADKDIAKPFALTVVPALSLLQGRSITIADDKASEFYVVLTNASRNPQPVFEYWNSWGSGAVSFELTTPDGKKVVISKGTEVWTVNKPSTFLIPPGEHQVYVIRLDKRWETRPKLTADAENILQPNEPSGVAAIAACFAAKARGVGAVVNGELIFAEYFVETPRERWVSRVGSHLIAGLLTPDSRLRSYSSRFPRAPRRLSSTAPI